MLFPHRSLFFWIASLGLLFAMQSGLSAAVVQVPNQNNAALNRSEIQGELDLGNVVELEAGEIYEIDARLVISEPNSGIQSDDPQDPATIEFVPSTANETIAGARNSAYGSVIFVNEVTSTAPNQVVIRDLIISRTHDDNTFVRTIDIYGSSRVTVHKVEIENFSLGGFVTIASSSSVNVTDCHIHDCSASAGTQDNPSRIQLTGIEVDDERKSDTCGPINSSGLYLANNRIVDLTAQNDQSDGINIQGEGTGAQIINNYIDTVGEGIDLFCDKAIVKHNIIRNGAIFGIKVMHGASENMLENNVLTTTDGSTIACVIFSGAELAALGNTFGNFFSGSSLQGPLGFTVQRSSVQTGGAPHFNFGFLNALDATDHIQIIGSEYNKFLNSGLDAESTIDSGLDGNLIDSGFAFVRPGDLDGHSGLDLFAYKSNGTFVQYFRRAVNGTFLQSSNTITAADIDNADNFLLGRFNGDAADDLVFHWKSTGDNRFYLSDGDGTYTDLGALISVSLVDGNPDSMRVGDFNADGWSDLFFHWKGDGTNWLFINDGPGTPGFTDYDDEIMPAAINGNADQLVTGDFNGDNRTDLYFYWKSSGTNRLYLKSPANDYAFNQFLDPNDDAHLMNGTNDLVVDDLNGDDFDDVIAYFPSAMGGAIKRVFYSNGDGTFTMEEYDAH